MPGSAKTGTIAERHTCELPGSAKVRRARAPPKSPLKRIFFSLTKIGSKIAFLRTSACRLGYFPVARQLGAIAITSYGPTCRYQCGQLPLSPFFGTDPKG